MASDHALVEVMDETISALRVLDLNRLETLERRIAVLAGVRLVVDQSGMDLIRTKRDVLEGVLHNSASNLSALNRLYGRDTRDRWEHSAR
ncbi:MAG: hypothetical protein BGO25_16525 [Acidobacteriales bacterium 59-55]|nr:hypothetical protein [Terriglobales bacterium]OJV41332.1 MAG: hypothetical protein BGO25_16525 [Acidobacteriales bacterium 59-55]